MQYLLVASSLSHYRSLLFRLTLSDNPDMSRLLVLLLVAAILFAIDLYAWQMVQHLGRSLSATGITRLRWGYWSVSALGIGLILVIFGFQLPPRPADFMYWVFVLIAILYFSKLFALPFLLMDDLQRLFRWVLQFFIENQDHKALTAGQGISRADFLMKVAAGVSAIPLVGMSSGIAFGAHAYVVKRNILNLPALPAPFEGMTIVQISDIHAGSFWSKSAVERGISMISELEPDLIFFTGDLVNNLASEFDDWQEVFGRLKAKHGIYSILGNHDYGDYYPWPNQKEKAQNLENLKAHHRQLGWKLLLDEHQVLTKDGGELAIIGVQNWGTGRFPKYGSLPKALAGLKADVPVKLLLSHDPSHFDLEVSKKHPEIDVTFSGHTHGMQFGVNIPQLKWSPVQYRYKRWAGLYFEGHQQLYVNQGFGYIGYPGRIGIAPEITLHTLSAGKGVA